ncbi:PilZ domain-containing protein [Colwellia sp. 1_MG-2023]|uniref:PilZ domain-containing protein n=1 Tax=Colwellia sp. 1_MG-2023 TaxID=3062649 RepID=UPI0026E412C8|nr:PilZ domain-containing protein [Colwellia sp. 1_MG-2023]MDO6446320.1 PilZ domain-containing protein [Colwellia sp. 1_MG-2023]
MTNNFSKYQSIIDEFRGKVLSKDFETEFATVTKKIPKTERFLLKMELKRLANPCTRLIDLRGHVDGECRAFEHEERTHYLDDVAIRVFEEAFSDYQAYTFGVYEAVMNTENNFRVIYQKEKNQIQSPDIVAKPAKVFAKSQYPAQLYSFGPYFNRAEERMNFAISLQVYFSEDKMVEATCSDISVNGCKFRFNSVENIKIRQLITLRFSGLEGEFQFDKKEKFTYEVRNIQILEGIQLVGVSRVYSSSVEKDGFRQFLKGYIQGNKRRYKINLDNTISALQSRSFEQFALPKSNELPIFIEDVQGKLVPRFALTCHNNQNIYQYWQDERRQSALSFLITADRFLRIKKAAMLGKSVLVYSFIHVSQGKMYFYTADNIQLDEDPEFMRQFLGFAASKESFAISQLSYLAVNSELADSPLTLANTLAKKDEYLNTPTPDDVKNSLSTLTSIVTVLNITDKNIHAFYQTLPFDNINTSKLKNFGHKRLADGTDVDDVGINYNNQRQEPRFVYKTSATVDSDGVISTGVSHDFSTSGLKIELDKPSNLKRGDIVNITFPQLQKITSSFELQSLPYEVMRVNSSKSIINLRVFVEKHQHIGRAFFKALIQKNREKLTPDEYAMLSPGLAKALRNIYSASLQTVALMIQTSGSRYKIETIATNHKNSRILSYCKQLSDRNHHYNLYPLLNNLQATSLMNSTLKKMQSGDSPLADILYVSINPENEMVDKAVTTKLDSELQSDKLKKIFISNALKRGEFFCLKVVVSRTDDPDMQYLNPELSYISSYAIHRGKQLEQDIWSVAGVAQVFDITQEAMIRYHLIDK